MQNIQKFLSIMMCFWIVSCGGGQKVDNTVIDPSAPNLYTPKKSKVISSKLKNTKWVMPEYEHGFVHFLSAENSIVSLSESTVYSNATLDLLAEDPSENFVVFNSYTSNENVVLSLKIEDSKNVSVSVITAPGTIEHYKEHHSRASVKMEKQ